MFEFLIYMLVNAFWLSLIGGTTLLFLMRLFSVYQYQIASKKALQVLFIPCSIGFYLHVKSQDIFTKIYRIMVIFFFIVTVFASFFLFYMHLELDFIYGIQGYTQTI
jgi:hypothetical protein